MADAVATQVILDGERLYIAKFTNISDGTGETGALKIDVSTLAPSSFSKARRQNQQDLGPDTRYGR